MATGDLHTKILCRSVQRFQRYARGKTDSQTDKQTDAQTFGLITILCTPTGVE